MTHIDTVRTTLFKLFIVSTVVVSAFILFEVMA